MNFQTYTKVMQKKFEQLTFLFDWNKITIKTYPVKLNQFYLPRLCGQKICRHGESPGRGLETTSFRESCIQIIRMSHNKPNTTERSPSSEKIKKNPFFDDFVDCIENLPSRLQLLLSEVRNVDVLVKARHRKLHVLKLEIISKSQEAASEDEKRMVVDNLLIRMHQLLIQCQTLGDQKIRLTSQIIDLIGSKTRQLGFDPRSSEAKFQLDIDEEKILSEFRLTCKKNRPIHHHYNAANSSVNSRSSTRQFQNLTKAGTKQTVEIGKKVYTKKGPNLHRDMWNDDSSNLDYSPHNATSQLNGHLFVKKKPLNQRVNQPCASFSDSKKSFKKLNESKNKNFFLFLVPIDEIEEIFNIFNTSWSEYLLDLNGWKKCISLSRGRFESEWGLKDDFSVGYDFVKKKRLFYISKEFHLYFDTSVVSNPERYGQDKPAHYTDGFFGRSARRSNFWTAKINVTKYTDGQKTGLKNTGGQKYGQIFGVTAKKLASFLAAHRLADRPNDRPFKDCPANADTVTVSENFGRLSVRLYGSQH
ncbi:Inhibitor of growth 1 [Brachionus plicatilis]|uniref:Inhibitor of growth 1 n=1 Tax=Brachionus plicatilis TaxID=10195 RepID=A0A3M7SX96_BRAPC|nr:Inhibitor of growth 1 [Brachionus plicatilis]